MSRKAEERQSKLGIDIKQIAKHHREATTTYQNIHKKSGIAYGTCGLVFVILYYYQTQKRKSENEEEALRSFEAK